MQIGEKAVEWGPSAAYVYCICIYTYIESYTHTDISYYIYMCCVYILYKLDIQKSVEEQWNPPANLDPKMRRFTMTIPHQIKVVLVLYLVLAMGSM